MTDTSGLQQRIRQMSEELITDLADRFVERARGYCPRRSGALADSITRDNVTTTSREARVTVTCGAFYGRYQDEGTGIFGPEGTFIRPRRPGGVMVFDWPAAGGIVFTRLVQGSEPTRFWTKTVEEWSLMVRFS